MEEGIFGKRFKWVWKFLFLKCIATCFLRLPPVLWNVEVYYCTRSYFLSASPIQTSRQPLQGVHILKFSLTNKVSKGKFATSDTDDKRSTLWKIITTFLGCEITGAAFITSCDMCYYNLFTRSLGRFCFARCWSPHLWSQDFSDCGRNTKFEHSLG